LADGGNLAKGSRRKNRALQTDTVAVAYFGLIIFFSRVPLFLQASLLCIVLRRRAHRAFPFFFAYTAFGVAAGLARFAAHNYPRPYFWTYWSTDAVYILLGTLAIFEVFWRVFGDAMQSWRRLLLFPSIVAASGFLTVAHLQAAPPQLEGARLWIVGGEIALRFAQVFTFTALVVFSSALGLRWNRYSRGIAAGFGFYATVMLWMTEKFSDTGIGLLRRLGIVSVSAYSAALLIWILAFRRPQSPEAQALENPVTNSDSPSAGLDLLVDNPRNVQTGST
jgi:hypothetical protein